MHVYSAKLTFDCSYVQSLKEKRQLRRHLIEKARHRFNIAIAEVDQADVHHRLVIGFAVISGEANVAIAYREEIIVFLETNTDATLLAIEVD